MAMLIFHDSMTQPKLLDTSSVDWMYPIEKCPLLQEDSRNARYRIYRSRRIMLPDVVRNIGALDLSIYLHGAGDAVTNCVRVYAWKSTLLPYEPVVSNGTVKYTRVGSEDFYDFTPLTYNPDTAVAVFNLKVADVWDAVQFVVSQPCSAVSVYANNLGSDYPTGYMKMTGALIPPSDLESPLRDDFDGANTDWTTP